MKVLVVDDEPIARLAAANALKRAGYEVTTAQDGREALEILLHGKHRLVVTDWKMPVMEGVELCRAIRSSQFSRYIYCIMVTGQTKKQETIEGLTAGADDYVHKPFNPAELILRVNIGRRIMGQEMRDMTIFMLAKLAESRDPETGEHLQRVRNYCRVIARHLQNDPRFSQQVDDEFVGLIYQASPLHDVGKVGIPDRILLKPGKLTAEEFEIMKTHAALGAASLGASLEEYPDTQFLEVARDIALCHHEKYDGHGYPHGLVGEDIPLCARIMAVADVYDALVSKRVYKEAYSHDTAKSMIAEEAGKHFDPAIVEAFLVHEQECMAIREQFAGKADGDEVREEQRTLAAATV
jgi:putative two-component system response regulator